MISGDISDFQIDTSIRSNSGITLITPIGKFWCVKSYFEKEQWIMVEEIMVRIRRYQYDYLLCFPKQYQCI
jgi:hypothetical protein